MKKFFTFIIITIFFGCAGNTDQELLPDLTASIEDNENKNIEEVLSQSSTQTPEPTPTPVAPLN